MDRERLPVRLRPLVEVREVVVKVTFCVTAAAPTANGEGGVQVTPAGAVPVAAQVRVTVPVKLLIGVRTRVTLPEVPAMRVAEVEVLPFASARVKSGVGRPVPLRASVMVGALLTTVSEPVRAPVAVGLKTTLMAQV